MSIPESWLVTVALALVAGSTPAETLAVIPVQKVLDMLGQINVTAAAAKQEEPKVLMSTKSGLMILQPNLNLRSRRQGETLEKLVAFIEQAGMLLQKMAKTKPGLHRVVAELLEVNPSVATHEFQLDSVIELLEEMHDKFRCELGDIEKEEVNRNHAYDLATLHLGNSLSC